MQKPEWTKIGTVEYCVGTDGVTCVWTGKACHAVLPDGSCVWRDDKEHFGELHCQPPKPRHTIKHYADGSCVVESVEKDEQGRPLRCAMVKRNCNGRFSAEWVAGYEGGFDDKQDAIARAVRYVETGE